ncbi:DUF599 family protein [uncultured Thiodictyon sp.]|uniref:DUF599 family protein n=1 Tax=uncultured Thiodictyon sp. TaxID=1846217 RepID=UPI0025D7AE76|nr:DUF599 family protein [uncultured Thiodictyon sp.]
MTPLIEFAWLHWVWGLDALGLALLLGYKVYAIGVFRRHPECTHQGRSNRLRRAWVESVRADGKDMLAIETLRNWVMSATMFASTCILIGLVINLPDGFFSGPPAQPIADTLDRAGGYYNRGTRVFILAVPFVLWLIGPDWFLGGVLIALLLLYRFDFHDDRAPVRAAAAPLAGLGVGAPHALPVAEVFAALRSTPEGLAGTEAAKRLATVGPNRLQAAPKTGPIMRFFKHFHDSLIYILLAGALVTALLGQWVDTGVILAVTLINAVIGFIQEGKAEQALAGIRTMLALRTHCRRDGQWVRLDAADLVPGDTVRLVAGDRVPADLRLSEAASLRIDESALTGESVPADKGTDPVDQSAGIGDRGGAAYAGTLVAGGSGLGVVTGTGARTELGRIGQLIAQSVTVICTDKTGTLTRNEMTVRHVVTRVRQYQVSGIGYAPDGLVRHAGLAVALAETPDFLALIEVAALCNDAGIAEDDGHWKVIGEPTEGALCTLARKAGFTPGKARRLAVIPFDSTAKLMATLHQIPRTGLRLLVKGAPGPVLERAAPVSVLPTAATSRWTPPTGWVRSTRSAPRGCGCWPPPSARPRTARPILVPPISTGVWSSWGWSVSSTRRARRRWRPSPPSGRPASASR